MYAPVVLTGLWSEGKNQFIPHWVVVSNDEIVDLKSAPRLIPGLWFPKA